MVFTFELGKFTTYKFKLLSRLSYDAKVKVCMVK